MQHIAIIGNGISGITCARYIRKQDPDAAITVISSETPHFFARTALMYVYMGHMTYDHIKPYEDSFWIKNRITTLFKHVARIDAEAKKLWCSDDSTVSYDQLVIACGSTSNFFDWPGQDLKGVQGLYSYQDLQQMEANTDSVTHAVINGGGLIGIELAEMLLSRKIDVTFLVREKRFWGSILAEGEARMIERHMKEHHINLLLETELAEILGDDNGRVTAVKTKKGETIACQFVGIATGVSPNVAWLKDSPVKTDKGVLVNAFFETNVPGIYAIGDCAQFEEALPGRKPIEQVWYTGRMQGQVLAQTLCGNRTAYDPGPWFNSAKFLDIEYQNYGLLPAEAEEGTEMFYWEHPSGKVAFRAGFEEQTGKLLGVNTFGFRLRHELFHTWLSEQKTFDEILPLLPDANFDPELYRKYEKDIIAGYNQQYNKQIQPKRKSWNRILANLKKIQHAGN